MGREIEIGKPRKGTLDRVPRGYRKAVAGELLPKGYIWFSNGCWHRGVVFVGGLALGTYEAVPVTPRNQKSRKAPLVQDTSRKALESQKDRAPLDRMKVLSRFEGRPDGLTCDDIEVLLGMSHQTTSARVRDLAIRGEIRDTGKRRNTRTGRKAIVWEAVEK